MASKMAAKEKILNYLLYICNSGNANQNYTILCTLSNTERKISSKNAFLMKFYASSGFFKSNFVSLGSKLKTTRG